MKAEWDKGSEVWLGNEDGSSNRRLIGSVAAAPLMNKAFNELYPNFEEINILLNRFLMQ